MEEQGAAARQAAASTNGFVADDENSQAEGTVEGGAAAGFVRNEPNNNTNAGLQQQQQQNHPHYENIYESIEQYNAAAAGGAVAPADEPQPQQQQQQQTAPQVEANAQPPHTHNISQQQQQHPQRLLASSINYRNDLYDRTNQANMAAATPAAFASSSSAYDVPRSVRSALGFRRNFQWELQSGTASGVNRFNTSRYGAASASSNAGSSAMFHYGGCQRQRSFDDTESQHYYNLNYPQPTTATLRYDNIYEQIRDEPIYRNAPGSVGVGVGTAGGVAGSAARVYGRLNVIGHGIGRIERHLSSSCGNIDHYNLGGHYAVLGHSHFGTVGHIRLNAAGANANANISNASGAATGGPASASAAVAAQRDANNVKNSASSFFSCLHGESSQSMSNIYRTAGANGAVAASTNGGTPAAHPATVVAARESRSASAGPLSSAGACALDSLPQAAAATKLTGAIPKIKTQSGAGKGSSGASSASATSADRCSLARKSQTSAGAVADSASAQTASTAHTDNGALNRISKSSLQWLLVNKWLPLWIGQGPDCKVIDFNFMFSRDCVGCDASTAAAAAAAAATSQMYASPRLGALPQDIVRFNAREMHAAASLRRDTNARPLHNALNRLREAEQPSGGAGNNNIGARRYEDPSYENVHVQWQNGFEFGRSRDYDQHEQSAVYGLRPQLQRARSESPRESRPQPRRMRTNSSTPQPQLKLKLQPKPPKYADPFRNYELNVDHNSFRPKKAPDLAEGGEPHTSAEVDEHLEGAVGGVPPTAAADFVDGDASSAAKAGSVTETQSVDNRAEIGADGATTDAVAAAAYSLDNETETAKTYATKYSTKSPNAKYNCTNNEQGDE